MGKLAGATLRGADSASPPAPGLGRLGDEALSRVSRLLLYVIVFIEGYCSLGAEVIALRRLVPQVGSSIVVTAPTIGFFLLALALGYAAGGRVAQGFQAVVARNFLIAAGLVGAGLSASAVDGMFAHLQPTWVAYLAMVGGVLCPVAWLLGQTVPILTNLMRHTRTGEASGLALYWSTLGSFLGSMTLSLGVMQWLGVSAAVFACTALLALGAVLLAPRRLAAGLAAGTAAVAGAINLGHGPVAETVYADYAVQPVSLGGTLNSRVFRINSSTASLLDESQPPRYARYIQHLRRILLEELAFTGREVLVLGAGGFTLSHREAANRYTYVDVDPAIRSLAEERFLKEPIRGEFVVDDARRYVATTPRRFDAVVVDVFSDHHSIPAHLVTREFWRDTRRVLAPDGVLLANLILDSRLESAYARNLLATVESVFGRCGVEVLYRDRPLSNVELICHATNRPGDAQLYVDERNRADVDQARSR